MQMACQGAARLWSIRRNFLRGLVLQGNRWPEAAFDHRRRAAVLTRGGTFSGAGLHTPHSAGPRLLRIVTAGPAYPPGAVSPANARTNPPTPDEETPRSARQAPERGPPHSPAGIQAVAGRTEFGFAVA